MGTKSITPYRFKQTEATGLSGLLLSAVQGKNHPPPRNQEMVEVTTLESYEEL